MSYTNDTKPTGSYTDDTLDIWTRYGSAIYGASRYGFAGSYSYSNDSAYAKPASPWKYLQKITVLYTKVSGSLTGFPVYIDMSLFSNHFWANVKSDGSDIRIYKSDNSTQAPIEIASIDTIGKTGQLWFRGDISSSTNTDFYIWYGNVTASAYVANAMYGSQNVWGGTAKLIAHFQNSYADSSSAGNSLTGYNSPTFVAGKLAGLGLNLDGVSQFARNDGANPVLPNLSPCSISVWFFYPASPSGGVNILLKAYGSTNGSRSGSLTTLSGNMRFTITHSGTPNVDYQPNAGAIPKGTWNYGVGTYDPTTGNVLVYLNGVASSPVNNPNLDTSTGTSPFQIGTEQNTGSPSYWKGIVQEARIVAYVKSLNEIKTEYNNQSSPSTFYIITDFNWNNDSKPT